jgi:YD repeat-containing protein
MGGLVALLAIGLPLRAANAGSTIQYTYDALGRLVKTVNQGGPNDQVTSDYAYDKAGNRTNVNVSNSPNGNGNGSGDGASVDAKKRFVVVPSGTGFALIFLN